MLWNSFLLAIKGISRNLMRSFLTMLGIVIGVAAVITMVTLGNGATQAVKDQVSSMGSNLLMIRPGTAMRGPKGAGTPDFSLANVKAIREQISGLAAVAPQVNKSETVVAMANNWSTSIIGSNNDYFIAGNWSLADGRVFTDAEETSGKSVCIIGNTIRRELYGDTNAIGEKIRVKNFSCEIIGVLKSKGTSSNGQDSDDLVVMPMNTVQRRIAGNREVSGILVSVENESEITQVQTQLTQLLREQRHLTDNEDDNFNILDTRMLAEALSGTTEVMTMLLSAVASVSLLVGGIGIMNIMLVSVTERTREIGIRLAIGALEKEVLLQFLIEAVVLAGLGGIIGIALATVASILLSQVMGVPYTFNIMINVVSFLFSAGIGVLFGYVPARKAARLNPIDALRHE